MNIENKFDEELEKLKEDCKLSFQIAISHLDEAIRLARLSKGEIQYYNLEDLYDQLRGFQLTDNCWQKSMSYDC